jgi:ABC-type antimicrobial peptide transport system permease subunit
MQFTVVGVMADIRNNGPRAMPQAELLVPFAQSPWQGMSFVARSSLQPAQAIAAIERAIRAEAPDEAFTRTFSLSDELAQQTRTTVLFGQLLGAFAACALLLAGFGVYALATFVQRQRVPEYALRLALGARPDVLLRSVFASSLRIAAIGLLIGAIAAWAALAVLRSQLFGFGNQLFWVYLLAIAAVAGATALASWLPARRAAAVDPAVSLRSE